MKTTLILFFLAFSISGFSQNQKVYEYLTLTQLNNEIRLTQGVGKYEVVDVKDEKSKDPYDFRPLLTRMRTYEEQGWELVTNEVFVVGDFPRNYVLMRREN